MVDTAKIRFLTRSKNVLMRVAHTFEALTLIALIFSAGYGVCMWLHHQEFREEIAQNREDYNMALSSLSQDYRDSLERLAPKVAEAASDAAAAAQSAEKAADSVENAAAKVRRPIVQKAPTVIVRPAPTPAQNADQINRTIQRANQTIGHK